MILRHKSSRTWSWPGALLIAALAATIWPWSTRVLADESANVEQQPTQQENTSTVDGPGKWWIVRPEPAEGGTGAAPVVRKHSAELTSARSSVSRHDGISG